METEEVNVIQLDDEQEDEPTTTTTTQVDTELENDIIRKRLRYTGPEKSVFIPDTVVECKDLEIRNEALKIFMNSKSTPNERHQAALKCLYANRNHHQNVRMNENLDHFERVKDYMTRNQDFFKC